MNRFFVVLILSCVVSQSQQGGVNPSCSRGAHHKTSPSPENTLYFCGDYSCSSCCSEEITKQISIQPIERVGNLDYHQCNKTLSAACSSVTSYLECLYQCSPNLYPWINEKTNRLVKMPVCQTFCDYWFESCKFDLTCVVGEKGNWLVGLNVGLDAGGNPVQPCKAGSACRTYEEVYKNGSNLCNNIYGTTFSYVTGDQSKCLIPSDPQHNSEVVQALNNSYNVDVCTKKSGNPTDTGLIVGIVFGVLGGLFLIAAGVAFYMRTKKTKDISGGKSTRSQPKPVPEEMSSLRVSASVESRSPDTPPNTRDASDSEA